MSHICEFCKHEFGQKNDLARHLKKKNGCIPIEKIIEKKEDIKQSGGKVQELHSLFKTCLDILRNDAEHLVGDEALHELSHFLILKLSEKHIINNSIDIYDLELYKDGIKKYKKEVFLENLEYVKFSKFAEYVKIPEKETNIKKVFDEFLWKEVLCKHPKFKDVFEDGKKSFIKESSTIKKIIIALSCIDFDKYDHDILGEAYERIFVDAIFGAGGNKKSELGQFFTPPKVKKLLVNLINPQIKENGEIESVFEPASGTGGILNTVIKHYKKFVKLGKITEQQLSQQLIKNIYGIEIKGKIFNLCLSNMLINTGEILPNVICADSIRTYHKIKVDNILANPPFSVTIDYDELLSSLGSIDILNDYIPIKAGGKNSEVLFLQMMIHCLNINGKCATVMLDGTKMYGSSSGYDTVREYLMKSCDLHEVILCPGGTFTSTASKTCILFFTKKKERKDVVEIKGKKRDLEFIKSHSTKKVKFYDFNPDTEEKHFIKEVDIKDIASNNYSLNYTEYNIEEEDEVKEEGIEWIELGKVCEFKNGKGKKRDDLIKGTYPVIGGGKQPLGYHNEYNREENTILCSSSGAYSGYISKYSQKIWASDCFSIETKDDNILIKAYLFYYLLFIQNNIYKLQDGASQPHVYSKDLQKLKIPIIPIEKQNKIVKFLDELYEDKQIKIQDTATYYESHDIFRLLLDDKFEEFEKLIEWQEQSVELNKQIEFYKNRQERYLYLIGKGDDNIKTLGELTTNLSKKGKHSTKEHIQDGKYSLYSSSLYEIYKLNTFDYSELCCIINSTNASGKAVVNLSEKFSVTNDTFVFRANDDNTTRYIHLFLHSNIKLVEETFKGANHKHPTWERLSKIKIPCSSLEQQKEIIKYCEDNNKTIEMLKKEIEQNNILANKFITSIIKNSKINEPNNDIDIEEDQASDEKYEYITYKDKEYILEDEEVYEINSAGTKGELFGTYKNNKLKKCKKEVTEIEV
jgi:type I restriction enzyme S subunit